VAITNLPPKVVETIGPLAAGEFVATLETTSVKVLVVRTVQIAVTLALGCVALAARYAGQVFVAIAVNGRVATSTTKTVPHSSAPRAGGGRYMLCGHKPHWPASAIGVSTGEFPS
jgi:hypothetical protein